MAASSVMGLSGNSEDGDALVLEPLALLADLVALVVRGPSLHAEEPRPGLAGSSTSS